MELSKASVTSNVGIFEGAYRAFNAGDLETVRSLMDEGIEWIEPKGLPVAGTHRGVDAVVEEVFGPTTAAIEDLVVEPERFVDGGDTVVAVGTTRGTNATSGKGIEYPFAHVIDLSDGRITRFQQHTNTYLWDRSNAA